MQKIVGQDDEAARNLSVRLAIKLFTQVPSTTSLTTGEGAEKSFL
jgi:hypothetical protein